MEEHTCCYSILKYKLNLKSFNNQNRENNFVITNLTTYKLIQLYSYFQTNINNLRRSMGILEGWLYGWLFTFGKAHEKEVESKTEGIE